MQKICLGDTQSVGYLLKRSPKRRTLGIKITADQMIVYAPSSLSLAEIHAFLQQKHAWINKHRHTIRPPKPIWQAISGATLLWQGVLIQLKIDTHPLKRPHFQLLLAEKQLLIHHHPEQKTLQQALKNWLSTQAHLIFQARLTFYAEKLGVATPHLYLSDARTRWGSCNSRGEIRLSWRLIHATPAELDYVIAHELAHLKEMNHTAAFWTWVATIYPNYTAVRQQLKQNSAHYHFL